MMKRLMLGLTVVAFTAVASTAHAQSPVHFGVSAGASMPTGDFGDAADMGYNVAGLVELSLPAAPVSFRGELGYNSWGFKSSVADGESVSALSGAVNAVYAFPMPAAPVKPYVIGGLGMYHLSTSISGVSAENKFGFNAGAGLKFNLGTINALAEVRYTHIATEGSSTSYLPISFGILF